MRHAVPLQRNIVIGERHSALPIIIVRRRNAISHVHVQPTQAINMTDNTHLTWLRVHIHLIFFVVITRDDYILIMV